MRRGERILAAPSAAISRLEELFCDAAWFGELGMPIGNGGVLDGRLLRSCSFICSFEERRRGFCCRVRIGVLWQHSRRVEWSTVRPHWLFFDNFLFLIAF